MTSFRRWVCSFDIKMYCMKHFYSFYVHKYICRSILHENVRIRIILAYRQLPQFPSIPPLTFSFGIDFSFKKMPTQTRLLRTVCMWMMRGISVLKKMYFCENISVICMSKMSFNSVERHTRNDKVANTSHLRFSVHQMISSIYAYRILFFVVSWWKQFFTILQYEFAHGYSVKKCH